MQNTHTSHLHRFGSQEYGLIAILMVGSAILGGLAGLYVNSIRIAAPAPVSAPANAPALAQPVPQPRIATSDSLSNELWQEKSELRQDKSQSQLAPIEAAQLDGVTSNAERQELEKDVHELRRSLSVHPIEQTAPAEAPGAPTTSTSISGRYQILKDAQLEQMDR